MHYKFLKKIIGIFGFKLINKNLVKNNRLLSVYSSLTTSNFLKNLFEDKKINFVIQIGSNDGQRYDELNEFLKKHTPKTIFVEPIKINFDELKKNYSNHNNFFFENSAISVNNEINELYKVKNSKLEFYDDHISGITSFNRKHLVQHGVKKSHIEKENVNSISIADLLNKYSVQDFDLLMIDTEGYDAKIVFDFILTSKIRPIIIFEYIHTKNQILEETLKILKKENYMIFKIEENIVCLPDKNTKKLRII